MINKSDSLIPSIVKLQLRGVNAIHCLTFVCMSYGMYMYAKVNFESIPTSACILHVTLSQCSPRHVCVKITKAKTADQKQFSTKQVH